MVRAARDAWLRHRYPDHISYYRAVMRSDTRADPDAAVGSRSRERWLALGAMQFDYLLGHGLRPEHRMLEIGCGNLRGGLAVHPAPGARALLRHRHLTRHPRRRAGHDRATWGCRSGSPPSPRSAT